MATSITGGNNNLVIDTKEFTAALNDYSKVSKRSNGYILNKVAADVAFKTAELIPHATKENINAIENRAWWVKYISKLLSTKGFSKTTTTNSKKHGKVTKTFRVRAGKFTHKQAKMVSRKVIANRRKGIGLLKYAWTAAALAIKNEFGDIGDGQGLLVNSKKFKRATGRAYRATSSNLYAIVMAIYDLPKDEQVITAEAKVKPYLQAAMNYKAGDMRKYIADKQAELAAKYSGVGR